MSIDLRSVRTTQRGRDGKREPSMTTIQSTEHATSIQDAVTLLARLGERGRPLAGGTWTMRARHVAQVHVALGGITELSVLRRDGDILRIGALVTHARLAELLNEPATAAIAEAARQSAFPQVRNVATIAGNIAADGFAEADLVPALLACGAQVELASQTGTHAIALHDYLPLRGSRPAGELITHVLVPAPTARRSGFARFTVRASGEYPIVNVAVAADVDAAGVAQSATIAVGSVEPVAKICQVASEWLTGKRLTDLDVIEEAGRIAATECSPRDGLDAPPWYRTAIIPTLTRRAGAHAAGKDRP
jgi:carbon-monoxide dehydrogenase medium subunit